MPVAVITGGAHRIGKGLALRFAQRGYDIAVTYNTALDEAIATQKKIEMMGQRCIMSKCNVAKPQMVRDSLEMFESELGHASVIVSNAGVFPEPHSVHETPSSLVQETLLVNTLPLLTIAQVYQESCTLHAAHGRLISLGSLGALEIWKDRIAYNVSKSALQTMALTLARGLAPTISVNTVSPGAIAQPEEATANDANLIDPNRIPMKRHGTVDDIFDAVWFFATSSQYITGQTIVVDGGYHLVR